MRVWDSLRDFSDAYQTGSKKAKIQRVICLKVPKKLLGQNCCDSEFPQADKSLHSVPWVLGIEEAGVTLIRCADPALFPNAEIETADLKIRARKGALSAGKWWKKVAVFSLKTVDAWGKAKMDSGMEPMVQGCPDKNGRRKQTKRIQKTHPHFRH